MDLKSLCFVKYVHRCWFFVVIKDEHEEFKAKFLSVPFSRVWCGENSNSRDLSDYGARMRRTWCCVTYFTKFVIFLRNIRRSSR